MSPFLSIRCVARHKLFSVGSFSAFDELRALARLLAVLITFASAVSAQSTSWTYDFGVGTGSWTSGASTNSFLPAPEPGGGTNVVRVGSQGGSFQLINPGGGSYLVGAAATNQSVNKFSIYNYSNPTTAFTLSFDLTLSGGDSGIWSLFLGDGANFENSTASFSGSQTFTGLRFAFAPNGVLNISNRAGGNWSALAGTGISQSNSYRVSIYGNNGSNAITYNGNTLAPNSYDLWVDGSKVSSGLAKGQLSNAVPIDSFMFYGEISVGNVASIKLDNIRYANTAVIDQGNSPLISSFSPQFGQSGTSVNIIGTNFTGATSVSFGGVNSQSFTVVDNTNITAIVPPAAVTGLIAVTTGNGTGRSPSEFTILDGSGTAAVQNGSAPYNGKNIFPRSTPGQTLQIVYAPPAAGTVEGLRLAVPSDFGVPAAGNVSVSGGGGSPSASVSGQTVTVTGLAATSPGNVAVSISGLTTPDTSTAITNAGSYAVIVQSRGSGGAFAAIASSPFALVTVPLANVRNYNTNYTPVLSNTLVAVEGVASVAKLQNRGISSAIQDATWGVALDATTNVAISNLIRGNNYAAIGRVSQFNGLVQISITNVADILDLGAGIDPVPVTATASQFTNTNTAPTFQSRVVRIENLSGPVATWATNTSVVLTNTAGEQVTVFIPIGSTATNPPTFPVNVAGIGGQSDNAAPFDSGWRIQPRDSADLVSATGPSISVSASALNAFTATVPTPSAAQNFTVSGANLTGDVTVSSPSGFEISLSDGGTFSDSINLSPTSGTISSTQIFVRLTGASAGSPSGNVSVSGGGATTQNVSVSGTVSPPAGVSIVATPSSVNNLLAYSGAPGTAQTIAVAPTNGVLTTNISASASSGFEVAPASTGNYSNTALLPTNGGNLLVRIASSNATGPVSGALALLSGSASNNVSLGGTRLATNNNSSIAPGLTTFGGNLDLGASSIFDFALTANSSSGRGTTFSAVNVASNLVITPGATFNVILNGSNSATAFTNSFWSSAQSWLVFSNGGTTTGNFQLGAVSADSTGGTTAGTFGFSNSAGAVYLTWSPPVAQIFASAASLNLPLTEQGTPGGSVGFTVTSVNVTNGITVTADDPVNFAVSTNNADFVAEPVLLPSAGGNVYVRLTASNASTFSNTVTLSSPGASNVVVGVGGTVVPLGTPILSPTNGTTLGGFSTTRPEPSASQSFTLSGSNLSNNVVITPPAGWQVSATNTNNWSSSAVTIGTNPAGVVSNTLIHVRLAGTPSGSFTNSELSLGVAGSLTNNVLLSGTVNEPPPAINRNPGALTNFTTVRGTPSTNQSFTLGGSNLTTNITVGPLEGWQVSLSGNSNEFTSAPLIVTNNPAGFLSNTLVYVRLAGTNTNAATYNSATLPLTSGTASNNVLLSGAVTNPPAVITVSPNELTNFSTTVGNASADPYQSFVASGQNLTTNITVAPSTNNFAISFTTNSADFTTNSLILTNVNGIATNRTVYVRMTGAAVGTFTNAVNLVSGTASNSVTVSGMVDPAGPPSITLNPTNATNLVAFVNSPGVAQQIAVTASNLPGSIEFTAAPSDQYEVAASQDGAFGVSAILPSTGGVALVRIKSGATVGDVGATALVFSSGTSEPKTTNSIPIAGTRIANSGVTPALQNFLTNVIFTPTAQFDWALATNSTAGRGTSFSAVNVGGSLTISNGARFNIILNSVGSVVNFSDAFWTSSQSWPVFSVTNSTTGAFTLGAISPDSQGKYYAGYGTFSLSTNASGVNVDWTPFTPTNPTITLNTTNLTVPSANTNSPGTSTNFLAGGTNLLGNITVSVGGSNFAVSTNETSGFATSLVLATNASGVVASIPVYVQLKASVIAGTFSNTVSLASSNATTRTVAVTGTVIDPSASTLSPTNGTTLTGFGATLPNPSSSQSFILSGSNLVAGVTITPPAGWQVSVTDTNSFSSSTVTVTTNPAGIVSNTTIHVRLAGTNTAPTNYINSVLPLAVAGSLTNNILLSGAVSNVPPAITVSTNALLPFSTLTNQASAAQSFTAGGSNLSSNITITTPTNFSIAFASNSVEFTNTLTLTNNSGTATNREIFVRLNAIVPATNIAATNISLTTTGDSKFVSVSGAVTNSPPSLTATPASLTDLFTVRGTASPAQSYALSGSNIFTNVTVTAPANFQVALTNADTAFSNTVSPLAAGGLLNTNIYVRVSASALTNTNLTGTITNTVGTLANTLVTLRARVVPVPTLAPVPTALSNFSTVFGVESTNQTFNLTASNALGPVSMTVTNGYEISTDTNSGFTTNLTVAPPVSIMASDSATNYPGGWTNGANGGTGWGPWTIAANNGTGFGGTFIGNPSDAGIVGMATNSFGLYANPNNSGSFATAERGLSNALAVGQILTFEWGINYDSGSGGNKGFNLLAGTNEVVNVNNGGSSAITMNGSDVGFGYGTNVMTWSFTRTASNNLTITANDRDGSGTFSTNIVLSDAAISVVKFYASAMQAGSQAQPYFNNLQIAYTGGNITNLPIHVRIGTNAPVAETTNSLVSRVTISSAYATNAFVNLSGTVASNPVITTNNYSLVPFLAVQGFPSDPQQFKVGGVNLLANVLVTPPTGYQVSLDGTGWADNTNVPALPKDGVTTPQTNVFIRVAPTAGVGTTNGNVVLSSTRANDVLIPVSRVVGANGGPQLIANPTSLPAFATDLGTASSSNNFMLTGSGLSNSVSLTAPAGFEISTDGATFVSNSTLTPRASGFISNDIAVRLTGSAAGIFGGNVTAAAGTAQALVTVSGTVYTNASAQIAVQPSALSGFTTVAGTPSTSQFFMGSARQLGSTDLVATASSGYEVSTNNTDFFASVNVAPVGGSVDPVAFHARISSSASATNPLGGTVTLSSGAAPPAVVTLDGKVDPARPLSVILVAPSNNPTIIAPGSSVPLLATVSDTNSSGKPVQVAHFEFRTNNIAIPGAFVTNVASPYTLTYEWTPPTASLPLTVSAWAIDVEGWEGSSPSVVVRNPDPGEPVLGFTPPIAYPTTSQIEAVAPATNGAFYIGGSFTNFVRTVGSVSVTNAAARVARILADGTVDPDFVTDTGPNNTVRTLLYSATNQGLYLGGVFTNVSGVARPGLARLAVGQKGVDDGTLDTKFAPVLGAVSSPIVNAVVQQYDEKILVGGIFSTAGTNSTSSANLARFNPDGTRDISFVPPAPNGEVKSIALQPDGKILIAGSFAQVAGQPRKGLARLNIDGTLDTSFTVGTGTSGGFNGTVWSVAVALDGSIYAGGQFSSYNGKSVYNNLAKLSSTGALQTKFNYAGTLAGGINNVIRNVQMRPGGDILVSGQFTQIANSVLFPAPVAAGRVTEFLPAGTLDATFNPGGTGANNSVLNASTLANGNLVLVGAFTQFNGQSYPRMVVLTGVSATNSVVTSPPFFTVDAGSDFNFSFTSSGSVPYDSVSAGLPRGVSFNAAAGTLSGIPLDAGAFDMDVSATSPGGGYGDPSAFRLQVLPKLVPYDTWKKVWFTPVEQTNAAVSGRSVVGQNPSGQPNFTVYALSGGSPKEEGSWILPEAAPTYFEGQLYMGYTVWYYPLAEAFYTVQTSGNLLQAWSTNTITITNGADFFQVRPPVPISLTNRQFLRLKISAPAP